MLDEDFKSGRRTRKHTEELVTYFELIELWDSYGIVGDAIVSKSCFLRHS
jgi:hypothetical protein